MKASPDESLRQAVPPKRERPRKREVDVRTASRAALLKVLEPLAGFALDAGLSIQDVGALLRIAAARSVAAQQLKAGRRVNISGIAASTGIPRAEVSRILKGTKAAEPKPRVQSTHRILAAWREDPRFTTPNGQPADLKIYGRGATFETLVKEYGRGLPARAVLDELTRTKKTTRVRIRDMCIEQKREASEIFIRAAPRESSLNLGSVNIFLKKMPLPFLVQNSLASSYEIEELNASTALNTRSKKLAYERGNGPKRKNLRRSSENS